MVPVALYSRAAPIHLGTCVLACSPLSRSWFAASGSNTAAWSNRWAVASQRESPVSWYRSVSTAFMPPNSVPSMACIWLVLSRDVRASTHPARASRTVLAWLPPISRQTSSSPARVLWMQ
ncbi:hypothetical protein GCM10020220_039460 [Nonomuraea rubra]